MNNVIANAKKDGSNEIDGRTAFKLYDTYGFPIELTKEYASDEGLTVDEDGFQAAMTEQQNRARNARDMDNGMGVQTDLWTDFKDASRYVGYTDLTVDNAKVIGLAHDGKQADDAQPGDKNIEVIFDVLHSMLRWVDKLLILVTLLTITVRKLAGLLMFNTPLTNKTFTGLN